MKIQPRALDRLDGRRRHSARRAAAAPTSPLPDRARSTTCGIDPGQRRLRRIGHVLLEGHSVREGAGRRAALEGAGRSRCVGVETDATTQTFGNACVQYGRIYGPGSNNTYDQTIATTLNQAVGSEDCLYLNIWRPATGEANLPVIVFIHGGSNVSGYTADPVYDGAALAKAANAVVVTANYRVGIFGWLDLPQLKTGTNAAERLRQLRASSTASRRCSSSTATSAASAAMPATSR